MLSDSEAWDITAAARRLLLADEKKACICVVNLAGQALVQIVMDGAQPYAANIARLKAEQAAKVGRRTRFMRDNVANPDHPYTPEMLGIDPKVFIPWAGGVPVFHTDGTALGGIGVSNLTEDEDEQCCIRAVEQLGYLSDRPA